MFELLRAFSNGQDLGQFADAPRDGVRSPVGWPALVAPASDVVETADTIHVMVDLPGYDEGSLRIQFENDVLSIEAERRPREGKGETFLLSERGLGKVRRTFGVNVPIDLDRIEASYDRGTLTVTLPKRAEAKPRKIEVKVK
jgi:HSP20 family protein